MGKVVRTSIVIYDNYKNVLILQRKQGKGISEKVWSLSGKDLKGKEDEEKCIAKAVDNDLGCVIFNLAPFKTYSTDENDGVLSVYTGIIRERVNLHKTIDKAQWIRENELDSYSFSTDEKKILADFFKEHIWDGKGA